MEIPLFLFVKCFSTPIDLFFLFFPNSLPYTLLTKYCICNLSAHSVYVYICSEHWTLKSIYSYMLIHTDVYGYSHPPFKHTYTYIHTFMHNHLPYVSLCFFIIIPSLYSIHLKIMFVILIRSRIDIVWLVKNVVLCIPNEKENKYTHEGFLQPMTQSEWQVY